MLGAEGRITLIVFPPSQVLKGWGLLDPHPTAPAQLRLKCPQATGLAAPS